MYSRLFNKVKNHNARKLTIAKNPKKKINPKFYPLNKDNKNYVLFVGSLEHLRKKPLFDLVEYTKQNNKELWIVGKKNNAVNSQ